MEDLNLDEELEQNLSLEDEEEDSAGFMEGYLEDEDAPVCPECGTAIAEEKLRREVDGENHTFCSEECADEFEESLE
ncbi:MAG: hypothetical protein Q8Q01_01160 [archaeon]|nr:hypothetical protein [archaeon]